MRRTGRLTDKQNRLVGPANLPPVLDLSGEQPSELRLGQCLQWIAWMNDKLHKGIAYMVILVVR